MRAQEKEGIHGRPFAHEGTGLLSGSSSLPQSAEPGSQQAVCCARRHCSLSPSQGPCMQTARPPSLSARSLARTHTLTHAATGAHSDMSHRRLPHASLERCPAGRAASARKDPTLPPCVLNGQPELKESPASRRASVRQTSWTEAAGSGTGPRRHQAIRPLQARALPCLLALPAEQVSSSAGSLSLPPPPSSPCPVRKALGLSGIPHRPALPTSSTSPGPPSRPQTGRSAGTG